jgi:hypothetical protein
VLLRAKCASGDRAVERAAVVAAPMRRVAVAVPTCTAAGSESVGPAREWLRELPAQLRPKVETPGVDARVQGDRLEHEKQDETAVLREAALSVFRVLRLATMKRPKEDGRRDSR